MIGWDWDFTAMDSVWSFVRFVLDCSMALLYDFMTEMYRGW